MGWSQLSLPRTLANTSPLSQWKILLTASPDRSHTRHSWPRFTIQGRFQISRARENMFLNAHRHTRTRPSIWFFSRQFVQILLVGPSTLANEWICCFLQISICLAIRYRKYVINKNHTFQFRLKNYYKNSAKMIWTNTRTSSRDILQMIFLLVELSVLV